MGGIGGVRQAEWALEGYCRAPEIRRDCGPADGTASPPLDWLAALLSLRSGLTIGAGRHYLLELRLQPLLQRERLADLAALVDRLRSNPADRLEREVVDAMTTNETLFFRDTKAFAHLVSHSLPQVAAAGPPSQPIRIWSAGASTGQEAYSIAMSAADNAGLLNGRPVRILGTDIAATPVERARTGLYTQFEVQRGLPSRHLIRHFEHVDGKWHIRPNLRDMCQFGVGNLLDDPASLGTFDIVFCRNVLIYFDEPTKRAVLAALARQLAPGGWLYLGSSETATDFCPVLDQCEPGQPIYRLARASK